MSGFLFAAALSASARRSLLTGVTYTVYNADYSGLPGGITWTNTNGAGADSQTITVASGIVYRSGDPMNGLSVGTASVASFSNPAINGGLSCPAPAYQETGLQDGATIASVVTTADADDTSCGHFGVLSIGNSLANPATSCGAIIAYAEAHQDSSFVRTYFKVRVCPCPIIDTC